MSAVTLKSVNLTNLAAPESLVPPRNNSRLREVIDSIVVGSNNTTLDKFLMVDMRSNECLTSLVAYNDALDSSSALTINVGIANGPDAFVDNGTAYAAYAQISQTLFGSALTSFRAAVTTGTQLAGTVTSHASEMTQPIWQRAGLSADPSKILVVQVQIQTVATTNNATGTIVLKAGLLGSH